MSKFYKKLKCLKHIVLAVLFTAGAVLPLKEVYAVNPQDTATAVISSSAQWVNTGLRVNVGDQVSITAAGSWTPGAGFGTWGPNGSPQLWPDNFLNLADIGVCRFCARTLTPHFAGLIGYIGNSPPSPGSYISKNILAEAQKVFFVGSNYSANAKLAGALWLNFNDDAYSGFTIDNIGGVTAQITVQRVDTPAGPAPFLDLPWDYEGKGLSFNEAALSINSYFDHEYPLLGSGFDEPVGTKNSVIYFRGGHRDFDRDYSSHDGYDYGKRARANLGDPVLAAASGLATYVNSCSPCGNMIVIDHGNGYQTRYLHLQNDGLITSTPNQKVSVSARQQIGRVGATGNVSPSGALGAHIHFGVFEDKNKDGNFEDNVPDGVTDPFGWQSKDKDPWETFTFFYSGQNRTGNKSYYLWKKKIDKLDTTLTSNGGVFNTGRYKVEFPKDATDKNLILNILSEPIVKLSKEIQSIGSTISISATDLLGNIVTSFKELFSITVDFNSFDITRYKTDTLSIYSSSDGINWIKESTLIDLVNKKATTQVDHLTQFALLAERKDTIAPVTTATLSGQQGQPNWFRSDVTVSLDTKDNDNGLGVDYALYKLETGDWETYKTPLIFTTDGHHKIEFYSVDKDENVESVKSIEFDIDKTPPEASIDANPKTIWPPNGKTVDVTITGSVTDDHLFSKIFIVEDEYDSVEPTLSDFGQVIQLEARRDGSDKDGRMYIIKAVAEDLAGNITEKQIQVIVPHDQRDKK